MKKINNGIAFTVRVTPSSNQDAIVGLFNGICRIRIVAPPEKGQANKRLKRFLALQLGTKPKAVSIISGHNSRIKRVHVAGVSVTTLQAKLCNIQFYQKSVVK